LVVGAEFVEFRRGNDDAQHGRSQHAELEEKTMRQLLTKAGLTCALALGTSAFGQAPPTLGPPSASAMANPYANPYMNPFLNPFVMANGGYGTPNRTDGLAYLWAANQRAGGIGSGRLSSSRPLPPGSRPQESTLKGGRAAAEMPVSARRPGGAAGRYFNRGTGHVDPRKASFGRQNRYFMNNGR